MTTKTEAIQEYLRSLDSRRREQVLKAWSALARGGGPRVVDAREVRVGDTVDLMLGNGRCGIVEDIFPINSGMLDIRCGPFFFTKLPDDPMVIVTNHRSDAVPDQNCGRES